MSGPGTVTAARATSSPGSQGPTGSPGRGDRGGVSERAYRADDLRPGPAAARRPRSGGPPSIWGLFVLGALVGVAGALVQPGWFPGGLLLALAAEAGLCVGAGRAVGRRGGAVRARRGGLGARRGPAHDQPPRGRLPLRGRQRLLPLPARRDRRRCDVRHPRTGAATGRRRRPTASDVLLRSGAGVRVRWGFPRRSRDTREKWPVWWCAPPSRPLSGVPGGGANRENLP